MAGPAVLRLRTLTCAIEVLCNLKAIILNHTSQKRLLTVCLFLFFKDGSLGCRSAVRSHL